MTKNVIFAMRREPSVGGATLSKLTLGDKFICDVLEDEVREIAGEPVASWKIHGVTAIPSGKYHITSEMSQRFGPNTLTVNRVPGYTGVRIHGGNTSHDTEGCLLPGTRNSSATVAGSRDALVKLKSMVHQFIADGSDVYIEIIPSNGVAT